MIDAVRQRRTNHWTLVVGLIVWAVAIAWCFAYYGQWHGLDFFEYKVGCLFGDSMECANYRDFIGPSSIPAYSPVIWYIGFALVVVGLFISRRKKA